MVFAALPFVIQYPPPLNMYQFTVGLYL